jgi:hypothetical protein
MVMPSYYFQNKETGEVFESIMSIAEKEQFLLDNDNIKQMVSAPLIHSGRGMGKPDDGFRDLLKDMKKKNSKGFSRSSINTF